MSECWVKKLMLEGDSNKIYQFIYGPDPDGIITDRDVIIGYKEKTNEKKTPHRYE